MFLKKCISAVIATVMSIQLIPAYVFAQGEISDTNVNDNIITEEDVGTLLETDIKGLMDCLVSNPEALDIDKTQINGLYLGSPFSVANVTNSGIERENGIKYIPLISNNEIISLITILKEDNVFYCSLGESFAPELNNLLSASKQSVALLQKNGGVFAVTSNSDVHQIAECFEKNDMGIEMARVNTLLFDQVDGFNNIVSFDSLTKNLSSNFQVETNSNSNLYISDVGYDKYLSDYPTLLGPGICWASVVASMVIFESDSYSIYNLSPEKVREDMHITERGATADEMVDALAYYLPSSYVPTFYDRTLTTDEIRTIINNVDPACMLYESNEKGGHATALYGCRITPQAGGRYLYIMEPHNGRKMLVHYPYNTDFKITIDNVTFTWIQSIRLLYN